MHNLWKTKPTPIVVSRYSILGFYLRTAQSEARGVIVPSDEFEVTEILK